MRIRRVDQTTFAIIIFYLFVQRFNYLPLGNIWRVESWGIIGLFSDAAELLWILLWLFSLLLWYFPNWFLPIMFSFSKTFWINFNLRRLLFRFSVWIWHSTQLILIIANSYTWFHRNKILTGALSQFLWLSLVLNFLLQWFLIIELVYEVLRSHLFSYIKDSLVNRKTFFLIFEWDSKALTSFLSVSYSFLVWWKFFLRTGRTSICSRTCLTILLDNVLATLYFKRLSVPHARNISTWSWT